MEHVPVVYQHGVERDINDWQKIFSDAGFSDDYEIMPVLGPFSVIDRDQPMNNA
jgi:hypothetical protein